MVSIPILVVGLDPSSGEFTEETRTVVVNREGGLILLKHALMRDNPIRIVNLQNEAAADLRIVGPTRLDTHEGTEWGVEYLKEGVDIWGVRFPPRSEDGDAGASALLQCHVCQKKYFWPLTLVEIEVLESAGIIENFCSACARPTPWVYADASRRRRQVSSLENLTAILQSPSRIDRRASKRLLLRLPVVVRNQKGEYESSRTENFSPADLAVSLALDLAVGDMVTVVSPLMARDRSPERCAKVLRRDGFTFKDRKIYGMRYAAPHAASI